MNSPGIPDLWGPRKNANESTNITISKSITVLGVPIIKWEYTCSRSRYLRCYVGEDLREVHGKQKPSWKKRLRASWRFVRRFGQIGQAVNAGRLFGIYVPLIFEYLKSLNLWL